MQRVLIKLKSKLRESDIVPIMKHFNIPDIALISHLHSRGMFDKHSLSI